MENIQILSNGKMTAQGDKNAAELKRPLATKTNKQMRKQDPIKKETKTSKSKISGNDSPIFLRKTYHMIDSCDPEIAAWSDNGETFVVKQPDVFEKSIIPQFFKHSKFSSFVRQLNFYGFRKIKYSDTIKIDTKLEAETANYWRFRHEKFIRGKPELLADIRRHNSQSSVEKDKAGESTQPRKEVTSLKSEVDVLKDRIADMSKNINDLTKLVQNMAVAEVKPQAMDVAMDSTCVEPDYLGFGAGKKRKKDAKPEPVFSSTMAIDEVKSGDTLSSGKSKTNEMNFTPGSIFPSSTSNSRQESAGTTLTDEAFVDDLLITFEDDKDIFADTILSDEIPDIIPEPAFVTAQSPITDTPLPFPPSESSSTDSNSNSNCNCSNKPDPALMKKLTDALSVLPHSLQEMLVNRLVAIITSSDALKKHIDAVSSLSPDQNIVGDKKEEVEKTPVAALPDPSSELALPLAAATLSALITQVTSMNMKKKKEEFVHRSLPVIPMHA